MFYKTKITKGKYDHTCELSQVIYNQAMHVSRGHAKPNFDVMNVLLGILKETPLANPKYFAH